VSKYHFINIRDASIKIGVLGGSFNPPHEGHLHVAKIVKNAFSLDQVHLVPTKQNPLKAANVTSTFEARIELCKKIAENKEIYVNDFERYLDDSYTYNLLKTTQRLHPNVEIYWIMGMDCVLNFHKWKKWKEILNIAKVIIADREDKMLKLRSTKFYHYVRNINVVSAYYQKNAKVFYLKLPKHPMSSTFLRGEVFF
jgi:nicotinate-nucleotide adenylyltransferase